MTGRYLSLFLVACATALACDGAPQLGPEAPADGTPGQNGESAGDSGSPELGDNAENSGTGGVPGSSGEQVSEDDACASVEQEGVNRALPADVILAVDQSASMRTEMPWVRDGLKDLAEKVSAEGVAVNVVLLATSGGDQGLCIPAPLGSGSCPDDSRPPEFLRIERSVRSHDALDRILEKYDTYRDVLRPEASKHVVVISDDDSWLGASDFDDALRALDAPLWEGYAFHGIFSFSEDPGTSECRTDPDPCCDLAASKGAVYETLVAQTNGVSGNLCLQDFAPVWDRLSQYIVETSPLACTWEIPPPEEGVLDPTRVNLALTIDGQDLPLGYVDSAARCQDVEDGWYYDDPISPTEVLVCPSTCERFQKAENARVRILFGCTREAATPR